MARVPLLIDDYFASPGEVVAVEASLLAPLWHALGLPDRAGDGTPRPGVVMSHAMVQLGSDATRGMEVCLMGTFRHNPFNNFPDLAKRFVLPVVSANDVAGNTRGSPFIITHPKDVPMDCDTWLIAIPIACNTIVSRKWKHREAMEKGKVTVRIQEDQLADLRGICEDRMATLLADMESNSRLRQQLIDELELALFSSSVPSTPISPVEQNGSHPIRTVPTSPARYRRAGIVPPQITSPTTNRFEALVREESQSSGSGSSDFAVGQSPSLSSGTGADVAGSSSSDPLAPWFDKPMVDEVEEFPLPKPDQDIPASPAAKKRYSKDRKKRAKKSNLAIAVAAKQSSLSIAVRRRSSGSSKSSKRSKPRSITEPSAPQVPGLPQVSLAGPTAGHSNLSKSAQTTGLTYLEMQQDSPGPAKSKREARKERQKSCYAAGHKERKARKRHGSPVKRSSTTSLGARGAT